MKNSHGLIILFLSAQLLLLSGCEQPPTQTPTTGSSANPQTSSSKAEPKKCLDSVTQYKKNLRKLDTSGQDLPLNKITAPQVSQKVSTFSQDLANISRDCQALPTFEKVKSDIESLVSITSLMADPQNKNEEIKKLLASTKLEVSDSLGNPSDDVNDLARKFIKYTELKLETVSNLLKDSEVNSESELQVRVTKLEAKVLELEKKIKLPDPKTPPSTSPSSANSATSPDENGSPRDVVLLPSFLGFGALVAIVAFFMFRDRAVLLELFNKSSKSKSTTSRVKDNKRSRLGRVDTPPSSDRGQSSPSGNRANDVNSSDKTNDRDQYGQNQTLLPPQIAPKSVTKANDSISKLNRDNLSQYTPPTSQSIQSLTCERAIAAYQNKNYRILESCKNDYYSATIESVTSNRTYSDSPLELIQSPKYKSLFWMVETSDYGYVLFPKPETRIDESRIQAIKYFFDSLNFQGGHYRAYEVYPASMGEDNNRKWTMQQKGQINFVY